MINFMIYWVHLLMNLFMVLMVLVSVAFITLLERKVLGYIQVRKGPKTINTMNKFINKWTQ